MSNEMIWAGRDQIPMPLSLGPLGDLSWVFLPGCRPMIIELVTSRLSSAMEADEPIRKLEDADLFTHAVSPVARAALLANDSEATGQVARFLWLVLTYRGIGWGSIQNDARVTLLNWLMLPPYRDALASIDNGLEKYVRSLLEGRGDY